jgi:hypothetical protein
MADFVLPMAKVGYPVLTRRCGTQRPRGWSSSITTKTNGRLARRKQTIGDCATAS